MLESWKEWKMARASVVQPVVELGVDTSVDGVRGACMSSGLSMYISELRGSICGSKQSLVNREKRDAWTICPIGFPDRIPFPLPVPSMLPRGWLWGALGLAANRTAAGLARIRCLRWEPTLHSCPLPPPLASRALLGPWCSHPQSFPSFSQDPEFLASRKGDLLLERRELRTPGS